MGSPEYQKAIIFAQRATARNNGNTTAYNEKPAMDGGQPFSMGAGAPVPGQYGPVESDASNPIYCRGFRPNSHTIQVFDDLRPLGPAYDVVTLFVGAAFNSSNGVDNGNGRLECGLGVYSEENARTFCRTLLNSGTSPDTCGITITSGRDNPSPDANHYATAGIWSNDLVAENAAGFGGATCTLAASNDFFYGVVQATCGSLRGLGALMSWRPWAGLGLPTLTTGVPQWIATRYHKYDPAFPNQHKISVIASWDSTVRTLTFYTYGTMSAQGLRCNAPRNHLFNLIGELVLAYDVAAEATAWNTAMAEQAALWVQLSPENKAITAYLDQLRGPYVRNTGAMIDQTTGTYYDIQGKVANGRELQWNLPVASSAYNVVGGWPSDAGSKAGVWLESADGTISVRQYIRNWGYGASILNYRNLTTAGFGTPWAATIRFVIDFGPIADVRGCNFVAKDATGAVIQRAPISKVSYSGEAANSISALATTAPPIYRR